MAALSPLPIGLGNTPHGGRRDHQKLEAEPIDDARHLGANVSPRGDDERFGRGTGGNQDIVIGFEHCDTGIGLRLVEDDGHQCGSADRYHRGNPSSP
jgi:hypothetical protein